MYGLYDFDFFSMINVYRIHSVVHLTRAEVATIATATEDKRKTQGRSQNRQQMRFAYGEDIYIF